MSTCNSCAAELENLLHLGDHPIANQLTEVPNTLVKVYPMKVGGCPRCGLVQLTEPIDSQLFYTDYATPTSWKREPHIDKLVAALKPLIDREARILDVGCNDGRFLRNLLADWVAEYFGPGTDAQYVRGGDTSRIYCLPTESQLRGCVPTNSRYGVMGLRLPPAGS